MEFEVCDRAVYLPSVDALVCADLHVGRDATSEVELPLGEHDDLLDRFATLLGRFEPSEAVLAGDLLHSYGRLPTGAVETIRALRRVASDVDCRVTVTPGNHDPLLESLWDGWIAPERRLEAADGDVVVTHGHRLPETDAAWYVVGHDHPTIEIEGVRRPCYLYGPAQFGDAGVLMLPTFSTLPAGVAVNRMSASDFQSPLIGDADTLRPLVRDEAADETFTFPPLGDLRRHL